METAINPIRTLRQRATCLEAAISASLAIPTRKAVHELRSEMRRIGAQLDLLKTMHGLPPYRPAAEKLLRRLGKLRHLAGDVRDCDVQRKLLKKIDQEPDAQNEAQEALLEDRDKLRKTLRHRRHRAERKLVRSLERRQTKIARDLETVLEALKPKESAEVSAEDLLRPIERKLARSLRSHPADTERLHSLRKLAKHARYECEAIPGAAAAALAQQLEELQDAGGCWHDRLMLAEQSAEELGADHPLARVLERSRDDSLAYYLEKLDGFRRKHPNARQASSPSRPRSASKSAQAQSASAAPPRRGPQAAAVDGQPRAARALPVNASRKMAA